MRKNFLVLIFLFFTFSILNAKPLKTEAELQNIRNKADKIVKEELKNDYKKEYLKRKNNLEKIEGIKENMFSDGEFTFELKNGVVNNISKNIEKKTDIFVNKAFDKDGNLLKIASLAKLDEETFLYREFNKDLNLVVETYAIGEKSIQKAYYSNKKLAYTREGKLDEDYNLLTNGKYTEYYKNGQMKVQGSYKEGKRDGEFKAFFKNGKSAGSVFYKDGKIIKSTLVKAMKDNASFSLVTDINYNLNSHKIVTDEFPNQLLKQYFVFNKNGLLDGESREYYEEGDIKSVSPFKNNVADGIFISYYQNGNIKDKQNYKNGNEEGEGLFYYENGQLEEKYFMKNGKLDGEAINYFNDGKIRHKAIYKDDIILEEEVHENNEIKKNIFKNEEIVQQDIYLKNKILKATIFFLENEKTKIITYHKNGNKQEEVFSINGLLDGEAFIYYPSGKVENKSFFKDGKREGESLTYYENGKLKKKILYKNGMRNGFAIAYYENGIIEQKVYFVDDKKENERLYYDKKGNLIKTEIYKNDVKQ